MVTIDAKMKLPLFCLERLYLKKVLFLQLATYLRLLVSKIHSFSCTYLNNNSLITTIRVTRLFSSTFTLTTIICVRMHHTKTRHIKRYCLNVSVINHISFGSKAVSV